MVDWSLARRIAALAARSDEVSDPGLDLVALAAELGPRVSAYTRLAPSGGVPAPEIVSRQGWAEANLQTMTELLEPLEERLGDRFEGAGPLAGPLRAGASAALAAELGLVTGYMAQRVLGQYELSLLAAAASPRLLFVGSNLVGTATALEVDREAFVRWVTVHELTHAMQFGGVPWLRAHMGGLVREYLETVEVRIEPTGEGDDAEPARDASRPRGGLLGGALERLRAIELPDPKELAERFREGGLAALVQTVEQRELMDRMQIAMTVVEGHAEHVMDALAPELVPGHEGLRTAMERRRASRSAPERVLMRLLGLEMKMRQYQQGKAFCDAVVAEAGIEALNRVWAGPEALPTTAELERPLEWLARRSGTDSLTSG